MGRIPAAVTHMAFGIHYGAGIGSNAVDNFSRENMGFEVLRVPVQISYDHLTADPLHVPAAKDDYQLVYKGEIPTNSRISFNEIGLWCGSANARYGDAGGRLISVGDISENWIVKEYGTDYTGLPIQISQSMATESDFYTAVRREFYDTLGIKDIQPRIGNNALAITEKLNVPSKTFELPTNIDLSQYGPNDVIKFAVSWIPTGTLSSFTGTMTGEWDVAITFNFTSTNSAFVAKKISVEYSGVWNMAANSMNVHKILTIPLGDLTDANRQMLKSIGIQVTRTLLSSQGGPAVPADGKILVDGIRVERSTNNNPLYGLVFYDQVYRTSGTYTFPIEKLAGFDGHIEHRVRLLANATSEVVV